MTKDKIKEMIHNNRSNRTLLWNSIIVAAGGTIGLVFKFLSDLNILNNTINLILDLVFIFAGIFISIIWAKLFQELGKEMNKLLSDLDKFKE